jgi:hypothetical protein
VTLTGRPQMQPARPTGGTPVSPFTLLLFFIVALLLLFTETGRQLLALLFFSGSGRGGRRYGGPYYGGGWGGGSSGGFRGVRGRLRRVRRRHERRRRGRGGLLKRRKIGKSELAVAPAGAGKIKGAKWRRHRRPAGGFSRGRRDLKESTERRCSR